MHNKYTQYTHTHIMWTKTFILDAINRDSTNNNTINKNKKNMYFLFLFILIYYY